MDTNTHMPRKTIGGRIIAIAIPLIVVGLFVFIFMGMQAMKETPVTEKKKRPVMAVMATQAVQDAVQLSVTVQGETLPRTEIDLVPEVAGKITYVSPKFLTGGLFQKNDVLYRIEDADFQVAIVRAEAGVARAEQVLVREQAESEIARQDWADLGQGQASSLTLRKPQLLEAQANLQSAQADLDNAQLRLSRTEVRAPFDGRVREKFADLGQYVGPGARLGRIFSTDVTEVRLALSDADLTRLHLPIAYVAKTTKSAPKVRLSTIIRGELREWNGRIMRTDSTYDRQTRSLFAIAEVRDPYGKGAAKGGYPLAPGLFVDATISGKTLENIIVIPRDGLRPDNKVYIVGPDGTAQSRDAIVLDTNLQRAVLSGGIKAGEFVILSPLEKSKVNGRFKALDVNDPSIVLVEPKIDKKDSDEKEPILSKKELKQKHKAEVRALIMKQKSEKKKSAQQREQEKKKEKKKNSGDKGTK